MKTLSVEQPWASLIVAGIKNIENRTWQPEQTPCRILIHASKYIDVEKIFAMPVEWFQESGNQGKFGNIPNDAMMPENAIIGYVTVDRIDHDLFKNRFKEAGKTLWADFVSDNENMCYWRLADAHVFDQPTPCAFEGEERLWEYTDIDEDSLPPAHKVEIAELELDGDKIIVPISDMYWSFLEPNSSFDIDITGSNTSLPRLWFTLLLDQDNGTQSYKTITFTHQGQRRVFRLEPGAHVSAVSDANGNPVIYPSAQDEEGGCRQIAHFVLGEEL